ncbi:hypothetical protein EC991_007405 [Linnemannia zychae]|nr:hypothetical protein EC991_007405 [Linnemannia zychae]
MAIGPPSLVSSYEDSGSRSGYGNVSWREVLKKLAAQAKEQEQEQDDGHGGNATEKDTTTDAPSSDSESEDEDTQFTQRQGRGNIGSSKKRRRSPSASQSRSRSRSRSTTPIDSHPYLYDSGEPFLPHSDSLDQPQGDTLAMQIVSTADKGAYHGDQGAESNTGPTITEGRISSRQEVYALGMEPHPKRDYLLADEIRPIDIPFLTPFLRNDLVVLTNPGAQLVDHIVLDVITSVFVKYGSKASSSIGAGGKAQKRQALTTKNTQSQQAELVSWGSIEQEVAQWITLTPSKNNWNELDMARLFVREMRRIAKRRWTVKRWNNTVMYKPMSPVSPT